MALEVLLDKMKSRDPMMIILCLLSLIEITPIKISPLTWRRILKDDNFIEFLEQDRENE